jgi:DNA-binding GntR family transcriptional regulator
VSDTTAAADDASKVATSKVVTTVFEQILGAVHEGTLLPGQRISDADLAKQFGVSRTPVREALQRLREIGIIEASPSRFTRVAAVTPLQTAQAFVVWLALYSALVEEVVPTVSAETVAVMEQDHAHFLSYLPALDPQALATANFLFFSRLPQESRNPTLQRAIVSVVHIVRLGSLHLPAYIDVAALNEAQELVLAAVRDHDINKARDAMRMLRRIEVPQD